MSRVVVILVGFFFIGCGKDAPVIAPFEANSVEGYWRTDPQAIPAHFKDGKVLVYDTKEKKWNESHSYSLKDNHLFLENTDWEITKLDASEMVLSRTTTVGLITIVYQRVSETDAENILRSKEKL